MQLPKNGNFATTTFQSFRKFEAIQSFRKSFSRNQKSSSTKQNISRWKRILVTRSLVFNKLVMLKASIILAAFAKSFKGELS